MRVPVSFVFEGDLLPILMFIQSCPESLRARRVVFAGGRRSLRQPRKRPATVSVWRAVTPPGSAG
jgi:hypothetical protein